MFDKVEYVWIVMDQYDAKVLYIGCIDSCK